MSRISHQHERTRVVADGTELFSQSGYTLFSYHALASKSSERGCSQRRVRHPISRRGGRGSRLARLLRQQRYVLTGEPRAVDGPRAHRALTYSSKTEVGEPQNAQVETLIQKKRFPRGDIR